jgi:2'-5' RNA ligase
MRLFFALDPDPACRDAIVAAREEARRHAPNAKWVAAERLHLTLVFVGELADERVAKLAEAGTTVAARHEPLQLTLGRGGTFGRPPQVLWLGVDGGPALAALQADLARAVQGLGVVLEERPYSPHLTLARARAAGGEPRFGEAARSLNAASSFVARELVLYRSDPTASRSAYSALARARLGGPSEGKSAPEARQGRTSL